MSSFTPAQKVGGSIFEARSSATMLVSVVIGCITVCLAYLWYEWRWLSHVPGPFWASLTKFWLVRQSLKRRQPYALKEAHEKYGMNIHCWFNEVV